MRAFQGFPIPNISFAMGRIDLVTNVKLRTLQSAVDTVVACMAISTSLSLGAGLSTSLNCRRSGDPYWLCRIAFTSAPGLPLPCVEAWEPLTVATAHRLSRSATATSSHPDLLARAAEAVDCSSRALSRENPLKLLPLVQS